MELKHISTNTSDETENTGGDPEYWLLRHGKAPHNKPDEIATFGGGRIDNELTDEGVVETEVLAEKICRKTDFDLIICSRMKRSHQTAEIIAIKTKEIKNQEIPIVEIEDLQEVDVGDFTGHTEDEARNMNSKAAEAFYSGEVEKWDFPAGEDYQSIQTRIEHVISQIKELASGKTRVLIVGHGMFNRTLNQYLAIDQEELWRPRSYPHDQIIVFNLK
jgi:probable phosphoglycerate mutase